MNKYYDHSAGEWRYKTLTSRVQSELEFTGSQLVGLFTFIAGLLAVAFFICAAVWFLVGCFISPPLWGLSCLILVITLVCWN